MAWFELLRPTERKPSTFAEKYQPRVTPAAFELLQSMFQYDPAKRPSAGDALEHPFFTTEEPAPEQAIEYVTAPLTIKLPCTECVRLKDLEGDWHEFESKALRRENERRDKEARRVQRQEEHDKEKAKRRASNQGEEGLRDPKRLRPSESDAEKQGEEG